MMNKFGKAVAGIVCMVLLSGGMVMQVKAEESAEDYSESVIVDTRPDYMIYVNRTWNCVTVMQNVQEVLTPVKVMVCSCGLEGSDTPEGTFYTSDYYEWRKMVDNTYGRYAVRFRGKILFHSVPYMEQSPDTLEWEEFNKLGENASLGCVRLSVKDAKWIYDNCKPGTMVIVYSGSEIVGGFEKPDTIKIDENSPYRMWDPTDDGLGSTWTAANAEYVPFTGSIDEFDYKAYADRYQDIKEAFGYDPNALYEHYMTFGIKEKRIAVAY